MSETLLTLYIATICAVFVVLLGWLVWMLVDHIRGNNDTKEKKKESSANDYEDKIDSLIAEVKQIKEEKATVKEEPVAPAPAPVVVEEKKEDYGPVIAEMLAEIKSLKQEQVAKAEPVAVVEEAKTVVVEEKVEAPVVEEEPVVEEVAEEAEVETADDDTVVLRRSETVTYAQAYAALSMKDKGYADEIIAYAKAKEDAKEITNDRAATVYLGKKQIVRLFIRKGVVIAKLIMPNNQLNAYADNNDLNIKEKPIDIKITKPELVGSVKDIIDLVYDALIVDRNRREEEKKERRRQARLAKKAQEQK